MNKKQIVFVFLHVLILPVIQEAFFTEFRIGNVKPNLTLIFLVSVCMLCQVSSAWKIGVLAGIYIDIVYGFYIGLYGCLFMLFGVLMSVVNFDKFKNNKLWFLSCGLLSILLFGIVESFIVRVLAVYSSGQTFLYESYSLHFMSRILPVAGYNCFIFILTGLITRWLWAKMEAKSFAGFAPSEGFIHENEDW